MSSSPSHGFGNAAGAISAGGQDRLFVDQIHQTHACCDTCMKCSAAVRSNLNLRCKWHACMRCAWCLTCVNVCMESFTAKHAAKPCVQSCDEGLLRVRRCDAPDCCQVCQGHSMQPFHRQQSAQNTLQPVQLVQLQFLSQKQLCMRMVQSRYIAVAKTNSHDSALNVGQTA